MTGDSDVVKRAARRQFGFAYLFPKPGLEPTPPSKDRILSPVRLPCSWYWKQVAVVLKGFGFKAITILP
jgi:hypothetical protein